MLDTRQVCFTPLRVNKPNTIESVRPFSGQYSLKADLKLNAWFFVAALLVIFSRYLLRHYPDWMPATRAAVILAPLVPCLLYVRSCMRFIRGMDEMQRRIQLESWLVAAMGTLFVGTAMNMLNANGIALPAFQHGLELVGAFVCLFLLWMVGSAITNRRYK